MNSWTSFDVTLSAEIGAEFSSSEGALREHTAAIRTGYPYYGYPSCLAPLSFRGKQGRFIESLIEHRHELSPGDLSCAKAL